MVSLVKLCMSLLFIGVSALIRSGLWSLQLDFISSLFCHWLGSLASLGSPCDPAWVEL